MPENNFEKQVQKMMEEIKLSPSAEVWPAVQERIQKKKRRRVLFFLLPTVAGLMLLGYFSFKFQPGEKPGLSKSGQHNEITTNQTLVQSPAEANAEAAIKKGEAVNKEVTLDEEKMQEENISIPSGSNEDRIAKRIKKNEDELIKVEQKRGVGNFKKESSVDVNDKKIAANVNENKSEEVVVQVDEQVVAKDSAAMIADNTLSIQTDKNIQPAIKSTVDSGIVSIAGKPADTVFAKIKKQKQSPSKKITGGIHFQTGISATHNRSFPTFSENKSAFFAYAPGTAVNSPANNYNIYTALKKMKPGISFQVEYSFTKQLSLKTSLTAGLQYHYASDHIKAGVRRDSLTNLQSNNFSALTGTSFYQGNNEDFTNQYHFLELPLNFQWQINKGKRLPISWETGIVLSRLIHSNGLVYDTSFGGYYYNDKNSFNKMMLSVATGLSFKINASKKIKWSIGPDMRFALTPLRKPEADKNKYLISGGLHVNILFPR